MNIRSLEWVDRFHRYLTTERRVSPHTVSNYGRDIDALVAFCDAQRLESWDQVLVRQVRQFAAQSQAKGLAAQSVQRRLSAVRTFMKFLLREGVTGGNYAVVVQAPKAGRPLPNVLDVDQMTRLIEIPASDRNATRDRAIMELLYSSALRLAELVNLDCQNIDFADRTVRVLGKGNVARIVPVGSFAIEALRKWLRARKRIAKVGERAVFIGRGGRRLGRRAIQVRVAY